MNKKPFPIAAVGYIICLILVFFTAVVPPVVLRVLFATSSLVQPSALTVILQLISLTALAAAAVLLCLKRVNFITAFPFGVLAFTSLISAVSSTASFVAVLRAYKEMNVLSPELIRSTLQFRLPGVFECFFTAAGFILLVLAVTLRKPFSKLWYLPAIPFALAAACGLVLCYFYGNMMYDNFIAYGNPFPLISMQAVGLQIYTIAQGLLATVLDTVYTVSAFLLGIYIKKLVVSDGLF